ncbi:hypothetical protein XHV734_0769 [Xanthomonas hortorum pv. vitians]|nr:hypothetical protein XHV734_0769 [Xanthomonas hortorum pv. vitians]
MQRSVSPISPFSLIASLVPTMDSEILRKIDMSFPQVARSAVYTKQQIISSVALYNYLIADLRFCDTSHWLGYRCQAFEACLPCGHGVRQRPYVSIDTPHLALAI